MTWIQALLLAALQGVTELFPISSLGHTVLLTSLLGWHELATSPSFLPFVVLLHVGTAIALLVYFWRDWVAIGRGFVVTAASGRLDADPNGRVAWLLIAGTIPAGLIGLFLETPLKQVFANPLVAAAAIVVNGGILLIGERARHRTLQAYAPPVASARAVSQEHALQRSTALLERPVAPTTEELGSFATLGWREAVLVGLAQALALIPGISRSGVRMVAALQVGMSHEDAAAYTFLLATPIIAAAGLLELPQLAGSSPTTLLIALAGGIVAGIAAYLSTRFLMRYFEKGRLDPFAYYCIVVGLSSLIYLSVRP